MMQLIYICNTDMSFGIKHKCVVFFFFPPFKMQLLNDVLEED